MMYKGESVTTEDLLKIAVGDFKAFSYVGVSNTVRMFFRRRSLTYTFLKENG